MSNDRAFILTVLNIENSMWLISFVFTFKMRNYCTGHWFMEWVTTHFYGGPQKPIVTDLNDILRESEEKIVLLVHFY